MKCLYCGQETKNIIEDYEHLDSYSLYKTTYYIDKCDNHNINVSFRRLANDDYYYLSFLSDGNTHVQLYLEEDGNVRGNLFNGQQNCAILKKITLTPDNWDKFKSLLMFS